MSITVCLDPGHGSPDPGAVGKNGTKESDVVLAVSLVTKKILEEHGIKVLMTRSTDDRPGKSKSEALANRSKTANSGKADLFVSIHCNSASNTTARGCLGLISSLTKSDTPKILSDNILERIYEVGGIKNLGTFIDLQYIKYNLFVLKHTDMPAVLIELGFLSRPDEEIWLADSTTQQQLGLAVALGILDTLGLEADTHLTVSNSEDNVSEWAFDAWDWVKSQKILDGTRPKDAMTREEFATVLYRIKDKLGL